MYFACRLIPLVTLPLRRCFTSMENMMKKLNTLMAGLMVCAVFCFASCSVDARIRDDEHRITVTGTSSVYAAPDTVSISFSAVSQDKNLSTAKQKNDTVLKKVTEIFTKYGIAQKNISIGRLNIYPRNSYRNDRPEFLFYEINQNISVTLDTLENYEPFLTELLNAGIDNINNVEFSVQDVKKLKNDARTAAVKAAEEKAALLCAAAENGGKKLAVGKIIRINEIPQESYGYPRAASQNAMMYKEAAADMATGGITPIGQIKIDAQVEVVFSLE